MTQSTPSIQSPLPDAFSSTLSGLFNHVRPAIVQVRNERHGGGTGIVWQADGQIITNNHVVPRDGADIQIHFTDGRTLPARVLHRQPQFDLALLKVDSPEPLPTLAAGDSASLRVGEWVFAIGHPWGQRWTVTAGVVSTMSTRQIEPEVSIPYIKSDVRLAPGNSGGPLLNADGEVVGINAMIFGGDLSVSIPSNVVSAWLKDLPKSQAILGVGLQQIELPAAIKQQRPDSHGDNAMLVVSLIERPTDQQSILLGDILLELEGQPIAGVHTIRQQLANKAPGQSVTLTIARGGTIQPLTTTLLPTQ